MTDLISIEQLEVRLMRDLVEPERAAALAFITDASALAVLSVNDSAVTDDWTEGNPAALVPVIVGMVRRALDNPHGYTSEQNSGYLYQGGKTEGIFATPEEVAAIRKAAGLGVMGAITLTVDLPGTQHTEYGTLSWLDGAVS